MTPDFQLLFEKVPGLYLVLNPGLFIVAVSDGYTRATMTVREKIIGQHLFAVFPDNPDDKDANGESNLGASLARVLSQIKSDSMAVQKYDIRKPDGTFEVRYWRPVNSPILDDRGEVAYLIHGVEDVTALMLLKDAQSKETEELRSRAEVMEAKIFSRSAEIAEANHRLRATNEELARTLRELETFSYSVSHDLRAPLRGINGFSLSLLEDYYDKLDETGKDYLRRIRTASERMGQLIEDLLKLSRVTQATLERGDLDLSAMASAVLKDLRLSDPERVVEAVVAPGVRTQGDAKLLRLVLENIFGNAWKYTRHRASARIELGTGMDSGTPFYFVRDNGAGFDMKYAKKLFSPFQRFNADREFEGTGIGLATVQRVIHRHGGKVWIKSAVDQGTTIHFTLSS